MMNFLSYLPVIIASEPTRMENVWTALRVMVVGMAGIFIALGIIYVACIVLQKVFPPKDGE